MILDRDVVWCVTGDLSLVDRCYRRIETWPEIAPDSEEDWRELASRLQELCEAADCARVNVATVIEKSFSE